jgi:hypothetical protein
MSTAYYHAIRKETVLYNSDFSSASQVHVSNVQDSFRFPKL